MGDLGFCTQYSCHICKTPVRTWIKDSKVAAIRVAGTGPKGRLLIPREELEKVVGAGLAERVPEVAVG
jgi:hypothetical protein